MIDVRTIRGYGADNYYKVILDVPETVTYSGIKVVEVMNKKTGNVLTKASKQRTAVIDDAKREVLAEHGIEI